MNTAKRTVFSLQEGLLLLREVLHLNPFQSSGSLDRNSRHNGNCVYNQKAKGNTDELNRRIKDTKKYIMPKKPAQSVLLAFPYQTCTIAQWVPFTIYQLSEAEMKLPGYVRTPAFTMLMHKEMEHAKEVLLAHAASMKTNCWTHLKFAVKTVQTLC
ncbi:hypothetical protein M8J76_001639 [Diaphorina citri]|nr:hypothetical protein M8J76_001639 [Diaphorina citri]KAI5727536.1 hypothetical protein M8J77_003440 [Diaphorina citri]